MQPNKKREKGGVSRNREAGGWNDRGQWARCQNTAVQVAVMQLTGGVVHSVAYSLQIANMAEFML